MSLEQGKLFRDEALVRVEANAKDEFLSAARSVIVDMPIGHEFTTDDVWGAIPEPLREVHEPRAMGAVVRALAVSGYIQKTGRVIKSKMPACHARDKAEWVRGGKKSP